MVTPINNITEYPEVGIGAISYNSANYIAECMDSLLAQTYDNLKVIVCDDHSSDESPKILEAYAKNYPQKIEVIINPENIGIQRNCNKCLHALDTSFAGLIACDDKWGKNKIELEINAMNKMRSRWVYSQLGIIDENSMITDEVSPLSRSYENQMQLLKEILSHKVRVFNWLAEKDLIKDLGFLKENYKYVGDWEFNVLLAAESMPAFVQSTNVYYRRHNNSITYKGIYKIYIKEFESAYENQKKILQRFTMKDRKEILMNQRMMLKTISHNMLLSSIHKKNFVDFLKSIIMKFKYKFYPIIV